MYASAPNLILGFHGCDTEVAKIIITQNNNLRPSANNYDWLGHGVYFWKNNPGRALEYAKFLKNNPDRSRSVIKKPDVIGAVIDLGFCLNLLESKSLRIVKESYNLP